MPPASRTFGLAVFTTAKPGATTSTDVLAVFVTGCNPGIGTPLVSAGRPITVATFVTSADTFVEAVRFVAVEMNA